VILQIICLASRSKSYSPFPLMQLAAKPAKLSIKYLKGVSSQLSKTGANFPTVELNLRSGIFRLRIDAKYRPEREAAFCGSPTLDAETPAGASRRVSSLLSYRGVSNGRPRPKGVTGDRFTNCDARGGRKKRPQRRYTMLHRGRPTHWALLRPGLRRKAGSIVSNPKKTDRSTLGGRKRNGPDYFKANFSWPLTTNGPICDKLPGANFNDIS
jgi:hypothetical protein